MKNKLSTIALILSCLAFGISVFSFYETQQNIKQKVDVESRLNKIKEAAHSLDPFIKLAGSPIGKCKDGQRIETLFLSKGFTYQIPLFSNNGVAVTCLNGKASVKGVAISDEELIKIEQDNAPF